MNTGNDFYKHPRIYLSKRVLLRVCILSIEIELTVFVWREGKWFVAYEPTSGISSQGRTVDEALNNIREALELYLEDKQDVYPINRVMITKLKIKLPRRIIYETL